MRGRESTNIVGDRGIAEEEKKKYQGWGGEKSEQKEVAAVGGSELREREIKACQRKIGGKGNRWKEEDSVTFRQSGVCFECMCGTQSGLKTACTPLNLHSQSSFFIPLITWLSSDQSTASLHRKSGQRQGRDAGLLFNHHAPWSLVGSEQKHLIVLPFYFSVSGQRRSQSSVVWTWLARTRTHLPTETESIWGLLSRMSARPGETQVYSLARQQLGILS